MSSWGSKNRVKVVGNEEGGSSFGTPTSDDTKSSMGDPLGRPARKRREDSLISIRTDSTATSTQPEGDRKEDTKRKKKKEKKNLLQMIESHGEFNASLSDEERRRRFDEAFNENQGTSWSSGSGSGGLLGRDNKPSKPSTGDKQEGKSGRKGVTSSARDAPKTTSPRSRTLNRGGARDIKVDHRLSKRSQRLLETYYETTEVIDSRSVSEASGSDRSLGQLSGASERELDSSRRRFVVDTKEAMSLLYDDEVDQGSVIDASVSETETAPTAPPDKKGRTGMVSRATAVVADLSEKAGIAARRASARDDIAQAQRMQRHHPRRRWQRFEEPGAVAMQGRAYGAPPRPPDPKPTMVAGLSEESKAEDFDLDVETLREGGVTLTPDGPLVRAAPVSEDDCAPRAAVDVAYAESSPVGFKDLLMERSFRWRLVGICFAIALLTMVISVAATHMSNGYNDDTDITSPGVSPTAAPTFVSDDLVEDLAPISGLEALSASSSPQRKAVGWLSSVDEAGLEASDAGFVQRYVMAVLYFAMGGEQWRSTERWLDPELHECDWSSSIHCEVDHSDRPCVTGIDLSRFGLNGHIPPEIGHLDQLESLVLAKNNLNGPIPSELFGIPRLTELVLRSNHFSSEIPSSISEATFLDFLDLSNNNLEGTIPEEMYDLTHLRTIDLSSNAFTGTISSKLENLHVLTSVDLRSNSLQGNLPEALSRLSNLAFVKLDNNMLTGSLPGFSGALVRLHELTVSNNLLSGTIPALPDGGVRAFRSISDRDFRLQKLNIASNDFRGVLPQFIGMIPSLREFDFSGNSFDGAFPSMPGMWRSLEVINGGGNQLTGIPPSDFPPTLTEYDFFSNYFVGGLPLELLTAFPRLEYLSLAHNPIGGPLPTSLNNAPHLVGLDLRGCDLIGTIPDVTGLNSLGYFDVRENYISGTMPEALGMLTTLTNLNLASNRLTGTIPDQIGKLSNLGALLLEDNELTGSLPGTLANLRELVQLRVVNNPMVGSVPEGLCAIIKDLSVDHVGCNLECSCCLDESTCETA